MLLFRNFVPKQKHVHGFLLMYKISRPSEINTMPRQLTLTIYMPGMYTGNSKIISPISVVKLRKTSFRRRFPVVVETQRISEVYSRPYTHKNHIMIPVDLRLEVSLLPWRRIWQMIFVLSSSILAKTLLIRSNLHQHTNIISLRLNLPPTTSPLIQSLRVICLSCSMV